MNFKPGNVASIPQHVSDIEAEYQAYGSGRAEVHWVRDRVDRGTPAPATRLIELNAIRRAADDLLKIEIRRLRQEARWATWETIAKYLGLTKQGAQQRYGERS